MHSNYFTLERESEVEIIIKRSRFIGQAIPIETEEEALQWIQDKKKTYANATHNCYAYVYDALIERQSDDGEPSGTAGKPMLEVLRHHQLKKVAVVVTRYFGGTLLGAGGLIRAYTQATLTAIEKATIVQKGLFQEILIETDYANLGKLEYYLRSNHIFLGPFQFEEQVHIPAFIPVNTEKEHIAALQELLQGMVNYKKIKQKYLTI